jgi:hypothetical protein
MGDYMTEKNSEKFDKVKSKIEKQISPYIRVNIPMPEGVDKEAFLNLSKDTAFINTLQRKAKEWLHKKK